MREMRSDLKIVDVKKTFNFFNVVETLSLGADRFFYFDYKIHMLQNHRPVWDANTLSLIVTITTITG